MYIGVPYDRSYDRLLEYVMKLTNITRYTLTFA